MNRQLFISLFFVVLIFITKQNSYAQEKDEYFLKTIIDSIHIEGNVKTKSIVILRELGFEKDDEIKRVSLDEQMLQAEKNLFNTSLFLEVDVSCSFNNNLNPNKAIVHVKVKERWYLFVYPSAEIADRSFNEWWVRHNHRLNRLDYGFLWNQRNVRGRNEDMFLMLRTGYANQIDFLYKIPYIDKKQKWGIELNTYFDWNKEVAYGIDSNNQLSYFRMENPVRNRSLTKLTFNYRQRIYTTHSITTKYYNIGVVDTLHSLNNEYLNASSLSNHYFGLSYLFTTNRTDFIAYPTKGYYLTIELGKEGFFQEKVNRVRFKSYLAYYKPFSSKLFYGVNFQTEFVYDKNRGFHQSPALGYLEAYPRTYEYYLISGQAFGLNRHELRYKVFSHQFEFEKFKKLQKFYQIPVDVYMKSFMDFAYVHDKELFKDYNLTNKFLIGAGLGFDFVTYYDMVVRAEFGLNHLKEPGLFIHMEKGI